MCVLFSYKRKKNKQILYPLLFIYLFITERLYSTFSLLQQLTMSSQPIDMENLQHFLFKNKFSKDCEFDFSQVWENIDSEYKEGLLLEETCELIVLINHNVPASTLNLGEQSNTPNIDQNQLSAFMGDMTPVISGIEESPMMNTPYLDSCLNTPFTPATAFTPSLNQFHNSPYYSPYIASSNNLFGNQFTAVDPQDIQVAKYLKNDMPLHEPVASSAITTTAQTTPITKDNLFETTNCEPSQMLLNNNNNTQDSSDFLFPPLPSSEVSYNMLNNNNNMNQDSLQQDFFNFDDDLFDIDDSLFNITQDKLAPSTHIPSTVIPSTVIPSITTPSNKRKSSDEKDMKKTNKRIKIDKNRKHVCSVCNATFNRRFNLGTHIKTHDKNRKKDFACNLCIKTFDRKHDLTRHVATVHNGERAFSCSECTSTFSRKDAMVRHKVQKHGHQL